jgi:hypothetical protein
LDIAIDFMLPIFRDAQISFFVEAEKLYSFTDAFGMAIDAEKGNYQNRA